MPETAADESDPLEKGGLHAQPPLSQFRFKSKPLTSSDEKHLGEGTSKRRHHYSHHRSKRRKTARSSLDDPVAYDDSFSKFPSDAAFRESLFDALGDDEGAAFWQGVYGQPIHSYPNTYTDQATGKLEQMTEEEYAQFVRRKMWEKSWEGIEAAKEEKRRERQKEKQIREEEGSRKAHTSYGESLFDFKIEESLRRGENRKERKRWKALWDAYLTRWNDLQKLLDERRQVAADESQQLFLRNVISWPVESTKRKDINREEIERFIYEGTRGSSDKDDSSKALAAALKIERVRWHPDKMQQRFGFMEIDEGTVKGITAVFQVFDRMWNEIRDMK